MLWYTRHVFKLRCAANITLESGMWLWQYTFSGRVYGLNLFSGMGDQNLDLPERIPKYADQHKRQPRTLMVSTPCHSLSVQVSLGPGCICLLV